MARASGLRCAAQDSQPGRDGAAIQRTPHGVRAPAHDVRRDLSGGARHPTAGRATAASPGTRTANPTRDARSDTCARANAAARGRRLHAQSRADGVFSPTPDASTTARPTHREGSPSGPCRPCRCVRCRRARATRPAGPSDRGTAAPPAPGSAWKRIPGDRPPGT
jgi:hypothetical protein